MEEQACCLLHCPCRFGFLPPRHKLVAWKPSGKPALSGDQTEYPQERPLAHELNACEKNNSTLGKLPWNREYTAPPPPFLPNFIFDFPTKIKPSRLCPFGRFVYFSRLGLLGWIYLEMHHVKEPRPGKSYGIVALLQFFLALWYIKIYQNT